MLTLYSFFASALLALNNLPATLVINITVYIVQLKYVSSYIHPSLQMYIHFSIVRLIAILPRITSVQGGWLYAHPPFSHYTLSAARTLSQAWGGGKTDPKC